MTDHADMPTKVNTFRVVVIIAVAAFVVAMVTARPWATWFHESPEPAPAPRPAWERQAVANRVAPDRGAELFATYCVACHGAEGKRPLAGIPMLNQPRVLAVASDTYYESIIRHGRSGTAMQAWQTLLSDAEIKSVVSYIRSWDAAVPDRTKIAAALGDARRGGAAFRFNCAGCHGVHGEGGVGNSLRAPSFLAAASDAFLRDTIIFGRGRGSTAMPAGHFFEPEQISDILAHLRSWARPEHEFDDVAALRAAAGPTNARTGAIVFRSRCAACHGSRGEGGIGSRLHSQSFLALADDRYLYRSIVEGRPGTAMPSWHFLSAADVADVITFLRSWQTVPAAQLDSRARTGDVARGKELYSMACTACHGAYGEGGEGAQLANSVFQSCASDEFLWQTIAHGKRDTAMRGFLRGTPGAPLMDLTSGQIDDVIAYVRTLPTAGPLEPPTRPAMRRSELVGREVYESLGGCAACHGPSGEGASGPALRNPEFLHIASDGFLVATIVMGREGTPMRSYSHSGTTDLSADQIESVVTYLRTLEDQPFAGRRRTEPTPSNIAQGKELFGHFCSACHGADGGGTAGLAPSLNSPEFLAAANDGMILATIAIGRPDTAMRAFGRHAGGIADLTGDEILKILTFIRSWESGE